MLKRLDIWFYVSATTMAVCFLLIVLVRPLWGIDFVGGSLIEVKAMGLVNPSEAQRVSDLLQKELHISAVVQTTLNNTFMIRISSTDDATHKAVLATLRQARIAGDELQYESIGPTIGQELRSKAITTTLVVVCGILVYLAYSFRHTVGLIAPWKFGVAAIYALFHDLMFVIALFVVLGRTQHIVVDTLFVTAILSLMSYSVNDTIVIFDRLREEWLKARGRNVGDIMRQAVALSITRSLNTSLTILLVLVAMLVLGGETIRWFIVALIAGTIVGTYSSIFVATPCLYMMSKRGK